MSLASLTNRDTVTLKRRATTQGTAGGQVRTATEAARGSLPTSVTGRMQPLTADEQREFGVRAERLSWKFFCTSNPTITVQDVGEYTDNDDVAHTLKVVSPSRNLDGQSRLYMTVFEETSSE